MRTGANGPRRAGPTAGRPDGQTSKAHRRRACRAPRPRPRATQAGERAAAQLRGLAALGQAALTRRTGAAVALKPAARRARARRRDVRGGFKAWLGLGYCVRKGEKAIRIIAPLPVKQRDRTTGEETGETITLFKTVFVFDAQQVEPLPSGEPTPLEPPSRPLTGDSHAHLIAPAVAFAESLGYGVSFEPIASSAGGWCDTKRKQIVVDADGPPNAQLRTLTHEVIHALGVDYEHYVRAQAESSSTRPRSSSLAASGSTSPARPSPMWRAGARTAPSRPSPSSHS